MYTPCELRWSGARVAGLPHVGSRQRMFCGYGDRSASRTASWPNLYAHHVPPDSFSTRTHGPSSRFSPSLLSGRSWPGSWCDATPHRPLTALHSSPLSAVRLFSPSLTNSSNLHHQASNFQHRKQTPFNSVSSSLSINGPHRVSKTEVPFSATLSSCLSRDFLPQSNFNRRVSPKEICIPPFPRSRASSNLTYTLLTSAAVRSGNDTLSWLRKTMASTICESPQPTRSSLKRSTTAGSPKKAVSFDPSHNQIFYINDCTEKQSSSTKLSVDIDDEPLGSIEGHIVETEMSWKIPEESEPSSSSQVLPAESNVPEDFVECQTFHGWLRSPERYGCDSPKDADDISGRPAQGSSEKETSGITDYVVPNEFETGQNVVTPENQDIPSDVDETTDLQNIREWAFQAETNEKDTINVLEGTDQTVCSVLTGLGSEEHSQSLHNVAEEQDRQQPPTVSSGGASIPTPMRPASTQLSHTMPMAVERTSGNLLRMRHATDPGFLSYSKLPRSEPFTRSSQIGLSPSHIPIVQPLGLFYMPLPTIHRLPSAFGSPIATPTCPIMPRPAWHNSPQVSLHRPAGYSPFAGFGGHFPIRPTVASPLTGGAFYPRFM